MRKASEVDVAQSEDACRKVRYMCTSSRHGHENSDLEIRD